MKKKVPILIMAVIIISAIAVISMLIWKSNEDKKNDNNSIKATVLTAENSKITIRDEENRIYTINIPNNSIKSGDTLLIEYAGVFDKTKSNQTIEVISYEEKDEEVDENGIPISWQDNGIFSDYYIMAYNKLKTLSLDEKIGQVLLVRYPDSNAVGMLTKYPISGFVFFEKDFKDKTKQQVQDMINDVQKASSIPLLTAVDEEGGNVVRVSSNPNLATEKFKSPQELYKEGGFEAIKNDTKEKSKILKDLGLNLNLAPVVDVSTDPNDYMYPRTLGENTALTSEYAKDVIESSKGTGVSYTLKHFPGYGNNADTHVGSSVDTRTYEDILKYDIPPFEAGIKAGAEAVLVSHNIVENIDPDNPASLSPAVHNLLRDDLDFTGVVITDDIAMSALNSIDDPTLKAILAGNDLIITTDYETSFNELKNSIQDGTIDESVLDRHVFRVLAWKYYKGLMMTK